MTRDEQRAAKAALIESIRQRAGKMPTWQIAEEVGCSPGYVSYLAANNGFSLNFYRVWDEAREAQLVAWVSEGMSSAEIGLRMKLSENGVIRHLQGMRARGIAVPSRMRGGLRGRGTHCLHGHEWTEENIRRLPNGSRVCRACRRERNRR